MYGHGRDFLFSLPFDNAYASEQWRLRHSIVAKVGSEIIGILHGSQNEKGGVHQETKSEGEF